MKAHSTSGAASHAQDSARPRQTRNGELGFWWRSTGGPGPTRPPLPGSTEVDVAIVGAGYTGLWTAYYLKLAEPSLRVVLLEREHAGFGASGRNGGWVSGFFSGPGRAYERRSGRAPLGALRRAMFETVDEVGRVLREQRLDADFAKDGHLELALDRAQELRLGESLREARASGLTERDLRALDAGELERRVHVAGARAALYTPHVARVHPVKLLSGLSALVEQAGAIIYERTPVLDIRPGSAVTPAGTVSARWIVRATEGYTAELPGRGRDFVPLNSSMIITAPLGEDAWAQIGWRRAEVLSDAAHVYVYLQRTADGRIAIGGRGVPYRYGSATGGRGETPPATVASLRSQLVRMFPAAAEEPIEHAWSGVLGVARDWTVSVAADPARGIASAGGYVGLGVGAANLAGRTLRDLLLGRDSKLTALPWVARRPPRWEPEPLRWLGIRGMYALYRRADAIEHRRGRLSRLGRALDRASRRK